MCIEWYCGSNTEVSFARDLSRAISELAISPPRYPELLTFSAAVANGLGIKTTTEDSFL
jgi:hypothetical protein